MKPQNPHQQDAAIFVTVTAKQALDELAAEIGNEPECSATVEATEPPKAFGQVSVTVRAPNPKNPNRTVIFVFTICAALEGEMPRVFYEVSPVWKDGRWATEKGEFVIPGAGLWPNISQNQVRDHVRTYLTGALAAHRL